MSALRWRCSKAVPEISRLCNTLPMEILPSLILALSIVGLMSYVGQRAGSPHRCSWRYLASSGR
jgi:hypothetical protein